MNRRRSTHGLEYFQMETMTSPTSTREASSLEQDTVDTRTPNSKAECSAKREETEEQGTSNDVATGRKGFKFGRLQEEVSFQSNFAELEDPSVIIANPAYQEDNHKSKKKGGGRKREQRDKLNLSSQDQKFTRGGGIVNRVYQEVDIPHDKDEERNQEVLDNVAAVEDNNVENDER